MWVHDTATGLRDKRKADKPYAILSHTWDGAEQTFQDVEEIQNSIYHWLSRIHKHLVILSSLILGFFLVRIYYSDLPPGPADGIKQCGRIAVAGMCIAPTLHVFLEFLEQKAHFILTRGSVLNDLRLSKKIRRACAVAREHQLTHIWVDISCIDKTNSTELSEAINSMFEWYRDAAVCYVYLPDVPSSGDHRHPGSAFRYSRWFTRGWTLQELLAPRVVVFLSWDWKVIGTKEDLADVITDITGIDRDVLTNKNPLDKVSVAARMSWAAERSTTQVEDQAYCLLGIFGIVMPPIYGEGSNAFRRLQEEILRRIPDDSIFAWELMPEQRLASISSNSMNSRASRDTHLMHLLDTTTGKLVDRPENSNDSYAVVSHMWDNDKVLYRDILEMQPNIGTRAIHIIRKVLVPSLLSFFLRPLASIVDYTRIPHRAFKFQLRGWVDRNLEPKSWHVSILDNTNLSPKIRQACAVARQEGHDRIWIDMGCVDYAGDLTERNRFAASVYTWFLL